MSESVLYGGTSSARVRVHHLQQAKERGEKWAMLTAYDTVSASVFERNWPKPSNADRRSVRALGSRPRSRANAVAPRCAARCRVNLGSTLPHAPRP